MPARTGPDQVLDAALVCVARVGIAKTTLDDVAREAGCARATVYRHFQGKQPLLAAVVAREATRFGDRMIAAAGEADALADAVVAVVVGAARELQSHAALAFVAAYEPEQLLPYLAFERESAFLGAVADLVAPAFTRFLAREQSTRLAEWIARVTLSYLCCPSEHIDVSNAEHVRALVEDFVLPGFAKPAVVLEGMSQ